jgi:GPH family glycoside/pentoside/hexuronide:cation symporter
MVVARLGSLGQISIYNKLGTANIVVDVVGYFSAVPVAAFGFDLGPYTGVNQQPYQNCCTDAQINSQLAVLKGKSQWVKTNGIRGGQENIPKLAKAMGFKVVASAYFADPKKDPQGEAQEIAQLEKVINAGYADVAEVGSEAVWHNFYTGAQIGALINKVRCDTTPAGAPACSGRPGVMYGAAEPDALYTGIYDVPARHADMDAIAAASDVIIVNIPPFNYGDTIDFSLTDVKARYANMQKVYGKPVIIGETEWPTACAATPCADDRVTPENAARWFFMYEDWVRSAGVMGFWYEAFDNPWQAPFDSDGIGSHWGVWDKDMVLKPGMEGGFSF